MEENTQGTLRVDTDSQFASDWGSAGTCEKPAPNVIKGRELIAAPD
jgi:hypothetical protein